jgi:hypothetical protein
MRFRCYPNSKKNCRICVSAVRNVVVLRHGRLIICTSHVSQPLLENTKKDFRVLLKRIVKMLEVEGSTSFGTTSYVFFQSLYIGNYDIRVWGQRESKSLEGFASGREVSQQLRIIDNQDLFHVSIFENGVPTSLDKHTSNEIIFNKRGDVEEFLAQIKVRPEDSEEECIPASPPTEAQTSYWAMVNDSNFEPTGHGGPVWR